MFKDILSKFKKSPKVDEDNIKEEKTTELDYKIRYAVEHDILPNRINYEPIYIITSIIAEKGTFLNRYYHTLYAQHKMQSPYSFLEFLVYAPLELAGAIVLRIDMPKKNLEKNLCERIYLVYNKNYTKHLYITVECGNKMCMWADGEFEEINVITDNELETIESIIIEEEIFEEKYTDVLDGLVSGEKVTEQLLTDNEEILKHSQSFLQTLIKVQGLKQENKRDEATRLLKDIIKKETAKYEDTDLVEYKSFRNSFEMLLYANLYHPYNFQKQEKKQIALTQVDLSGAYFMYGGMMLEQKQYDKALDILWKGYELNPVNVSIMFAIADAYKGKNYLKSYISVIRKAHSCAVKKADISRIYRNYAYYYTQIKDYDSAFSLIYAAKYFDAQGFSTALREIEHLSQKTFDEPTIEELKKTLNDLNISWGAKELTVSVISLLDKEFMHSQNQQGIKMCAELKKEISFEN
ncbi:MAG: hypothetical protein IKK18_03725 [Clostridia bacterium]|nr:hypothetical protein [Clostridia bacterium]